MHDLTLDIRTEPLRSLRRIHPQSELSAPRSSRLNPLPTVATHLPDRQRLSVRRPSDLCQCAGGCGVYMLCQRG